MDTIPPRNHVRTFCVQLGYPVLGQLRDLRESCRYGFVLSNVAESVICQWMLRSQKWIESWGLDREFITRMGYFPGQGGRSRHTSLACEEEGIIKPRFMSIPRCVIEMLPEQEHTTRRNQFYQCTPEAMIERILEQELPYCLREIGIEPEN